MRILECSVPVLKAVEIFRECPWFPRLCTANLLPGPDEPHQPGWEADREKIEFN
jgi:hypothetical protein